MAWEVATNVIHHVATTASVWATSWPCVTHPLEQETENERRAQLQKHGVRHVVEKYKVADDAKLYVLDRVCGIFDRDWSHKRLHLFLQAFADWSGLNLCIASTKEGASCAAVLARNERSSHTLRFVRVECGGALYLGLGQQAESDAHTCCEIRLEKMEEGKRGAC